MKYEDPILALYDFQKELFSYDETLPIGTNILKLFNDCIYGLNYPEIIASYALVPHRIGLCYPLLILHGREGTGKSKILSLISKIRNLDSPFSAGTVTFASLRNSIEAMREYEGIPREGCMLLLDNIHNSHLKIGEDLYNLLLTGYKRGGKSAIASEKRGETIEFHTFCAKALTTVDSIHLDSSKLELQRRLLPIKVDKHESMFLDNLKDYDLSLIKHYFYSFWDDDKYKDFVFLKKDINDLINLLRGNLSVHFMDRKEIFLDVLTTSVITGIFSNQNEAINYFSRYSDETFSESTLIDNILQEYLSIHGDKTIIIKSLKSFIEGLRTHGIIDSSIKFSGIKRLLETKYNYRQDNDVLVKQ